MFLFNYSTKEDKINIVPLLKGFTPMDDNDLNVIPKLLWQVCYKKSDINLFVHANMKKYANGYEYILIDHEYFINFAKAHYANIVLETFHKLESIFKSDFVRYAILYVYGGIFLATDAELLVNVSEWLNSNKFYAILSNDNIHQSIIASVPRNLIFLKSIKHIIWAAKNIKGKLQSQFFNNIMYKILIKQFKKMHSSATLLPGLNRIGSENTTLSEFYLLEEKCSRNPKDCKYGVNEYGNCCFIYDSANPTKNRIASTSRAPFLI